MVSFSAVLVASLLCATGVLGAPSPKIHRRALPISIDASTAKTYLNSLTVETPSNSPAYDRDLFKTWDTINGTCNTRETVLARDGTNVVAGSDCAPTSGNWISAYDDVATTLPSDLDIDHVVPLKEAWISGARDWTDDEREAFANDLTRPQLIAVTDNLNQAKSDKDPAEWLPPLDSFKCSYILAYVEVKQYYKLSVDDDEKAAIAGVLSEYC